MWNEILKSLFIITLLLSVLVAFSVQAASDESVNLSPDKVWRAVVECNSTGADCTVYVQRVGSKEMHWVLKEPFPKQPVVHWLSAGLLEVRVRCGSPCNASIFFSPAKGVSTTHPSVIAVNPDRLVLAIADNARPKPAVVVLPIFGEQKPLAVAALNFSPVAALVSAITKASFLPSGELELAYTSGAEFNDAYERVKVKY